MAQYNKGEQIPLYVEFTYNDKIIDVELPRVRILQEKDNNIYEIMSWQTMIPFNNGYIYNFNSDECPDIGEYIVVYEGMFNDKKINNIESFELIVTNEITNNTTNNIKIYGFVNDLSANKLLQDVNIKITDLINNNIVCQVKSDYSGRWETFIFPGEFQFEFSLDNYETKTLQVQIGDENTEIQFNNISLENINDKNLGNGTFKISDEFTDKTGLGIQDITVNIYSLSNMNDVLVSVKTDFYGKWTAFLNQGDYLLKIELPSKTTKLFKMNVNSEGIKTISPFNENKSKEINNINTTIGNQSITDYVLNAHGEGIENVHIVIYQNNQLIGETYTGVDGSFTLNLDEGTYQIICEKDNFKQYSFELNV